MEIKEIQAIEGANVYSHRQIIRAIVDLQEWTDRTSDTMGDFSRRLMECLPNLANHYCSRGKPGGFLERLREGTLVGHILEHVTIELLTLAGQDIPYGKTMAVLQHPGEYEIIFNYESEEGAVAAFDLAFDLVRRLLAGTAVSFEQVEGLVTQVQQAIARNELGVSTRMLIEACRKRGIPVHRLNKGSLLQLGYGKHQRRLQAAMTDRTACIGVDIACDKALTKELLAAGGVPVPDGYSVTSEEGAVEAYLRIGGEVVVKPYNGNQGKGVSLRLGTEREVRAAFKVAQIYGDEVIVEKYIEGRQYRLLVVGGSMVAATERIPAHIVGDGRSTIEQLIAQVNCDPRRGEGHEKALTKIKVDAVVILTLAQSNMTLQSIPELGQIVYLRDSANLSTGGLAEDVTDIVHRDNAELAVYAAQIVGLDVAGVDLVTGNVAVSWRRAGGYIIEINAAPGLRMHHMPNAGLSRNVAETIVDQVMPQGNGRIPIVAITGTNGKTTTTRLVNKMLLEQQLHVGMTSTDGVYINGKLLVAGDRTGPESARIVLRHPEVQVAVLETARGGILRAGLGYDYADVAVITNVSGDHLGQYGIETVEDIAHVKSLVAEAVRPHSYVVLNADDPHVVAMAGRTKGKVILFSLENDNLRIRKHLALGGIAVFVKRGAVLLCQGEKSYRICHLKQVPITWAGKAKHNVQNVLAAVAVGWALGLSGETMQNTLTKFHSDAHDNRGRLNYYSVGGVQVFIDYGHNASGIQEIIETLKKFKGRSRVGCITVPGDRPDESIREVARVAAEGFQRLIIREDTDLRGRQPGEIARILYEEVISCGMDPKRVTVVLPERQAFAYGLDSCRPGDIFVMFYEHWGPIEEEINLRLAQEQALAEIEGNKAVGIGV